MVAFFLHFMSVQTNHREFKSNEHYIDIVLICDNVILPANIGGILRLADAYGVSEVVFKSQDNKLSQKSKSVSRGTNKYVKHSFADNIEISDFGIDREWVCLEITDKSLPLSKFQLNKSNKIGVIIGNESQGVGTEFLLKIPAFHIKMFGMNSSMNVTNSLSAFLFHVTQ